MSVTVNGTTVLSGAAYEPFGPVGGWTWGNSTPGAPNLHLRLYDLDYRATSVSSDQPQSGATPICRWDFTWDAASRITALTVPASAANSFGYGYDALDRLTSVTPSASPQLFGFTYDKVGNRLTSTASGATTNYTYPTSSHRLSTLSGAQTLSYMYDANGNQTAAGTATWAYGGNNRPISVTTANTTTFAINALGQRVRKASPTSATRFVYDEAGRLIGEYDDTGALVQETVWLNDLPVATLRPDGTTVAIYYVHPDHLGTPRAVTRPSDNQLVWRWENTEPFGNSVPDENPSALGVFAYNLRFPGQYYDVESGLSYNYNRDYDSRLGRYIQSDPIGLDGGLNTFAYAVAQPIAYADPFGLRSPGPQPVPPSFIRPQPDWGRDPGKENRERWGNRARCLSGKCFPGADDYPGGGSDAAVRCGWSCPKNPNSCSPDDPDPKSGYSLFAPAPGCVFRCITGPYLRSSQ